MYSYIDDGMSGRERADENESHVCQYFCEVVKCR